MKSGEYSTDPNDHARKNRINRIAFEKHARKNNPFKFVTVMPSITGGDIQIGHELGMYDENTRFRVIEKGVPGMQQMEYEEHLRKMFDGIFQMNRQLSSYCTLIYKKLEKCIYGVLPQYSSVIDLADYDTCSTFSTGNQWLSNEINTLKHGAPVMMTFFTDYSGRNMNLDYNWLMDFTPVAGKIKHYFDKDKFTNRRCLETVEGRLSRLMGYLQTFSIMVNNAWLYNEKNSYSSLMAFIDGVYQG